MWRRADGEDLLQTVADSYSPERCAEMRPSSIRLYWLSFDVTAVTDL